jgi:hypothetical protein
MKIRVNSPALESVNLESLGRALGDGAGAVSAVFADASGVIA